MSGGLTAGVARGFRWSMVDTVLQQAVRLLITVVLTRLIAPNDFGLLAMALVFTQLASLIGDLGFGPALVQRKVVEQRHIKTATTATFIFGVVLTLGLIAAAGSVANFYDQPDLVTILQVLALTYLFRGIAGVPRDLLRREMRFDLFVIVSAVSIGVSGIVGLFLAFQDHGVWALVVQVLLESILGALTAGALAWRAGLWSPRAGFERQAFKEMAGFGLFVSGTRVAGYGVSNIDNLIVGKVLGASALGLYNLAYRLMLFPILKVADVVANVTMPALSTLQDDIPRMASAYKRALQAVAMVCFPVSVGIAIAAPALVPAVFGSAWLGAVVVVQILAANGVRLAFGRINGAVYQAAGKPKWDFILVAVTFVVYTVAFLVTAEHGIEAVAWAFTVAGHALLPLDFIFISRVLGQKVRSIASPLLPAAAASAIMGFCAAVSMWLTGSMDDGPRTLLVIAVSIVSYVAALAVVAPAAIDTLFKQLTRR